MTSPCHRPILSFAFVALVSSSALCAGNDGFIEHYKGTPFHDSQYSGGSQKIPGKVYCAYYDLGGEGIAYHDSDAKNSGSGGLNPLDGTYLNEFRERRERRHPRIPNSLSTATRLTTTPARKIPRRRSGPSSTSVGWTEPGEWFKQ